MRDAEKNQSAGAIFLNMLFAVIALFLNGFGVYLTIHADIGAGPWDVFNLGLSKTFGILYGNASIAVSFAVLLIDMAMREPIGIAMFLDALTVGKSVDFFNRLELIPVPLTLTGRIAMLFAGLVVMGYTQYLYMRTALGCGPRDTLLVGIKKRCSRIPIGVVSIMILALVTFIGYMLGGPVGIGTLLCAFCSGPVMQLAFQTVHFDAAAVKHQNLLASFRVIFGKNGAESGADETAEPTGEPDCRTQDGGEQNLE